MVQWVPIPYDKQELPQDQTNKGHLCCFPKTREEKEDSMTNIWFLGVGVTGQSWCVSEAVWYLYCGTYLEGVFCRLENEHIGLGCSHLP